jgi:hypothetical protein
MRDDLPQTRRAYQLRILGDMNLPKGERSADDRPVKARDMKCVLEAIDNQARESGWYSRPIAPPDREHPERGQHLLRDSQLDSVRQVKRALEVLERLKLVRKRTEKLVSGARRCHWQIDFEQLCRWAGLPKWTECIPSAQTEGTKCPTEQTQVPNSTPPSAHAGTPVYTARARSVSAPSPLLSSSDVLDADGDDERFFSAEDLAEIRRLANELAERLPFKDWKDRETALKLATLRFTNDISGNDWGDLLESLDEKRKKRDLKKPWGWTWERLRQRFGEKNIERLLARCKFPRELLAAPAAAAGEAL